MIITELSEYKGDTWQIQLEGDRRYYVNSAIVEDFHLEKGEDISPAELEKITSADILRKAKKRGMYLLGERDYCKAELTAKLTRTYNEDIAREAVEYICSLGYINDEEYAEKLANYLIKSKRYGVRRAKQEMYRRGLSRELIDNSLAEFSEEEIDEELTALIEKKYSGKISDFDSRRKTVAALVRRGYDFGAVKRCVEAVLDKHCEEFEDYEDDIDE